MAGRGSLARRLALVVGALLLSLGLARGAQAHALLLRSIPAANADLSTPPDFIDL